MPAPNNRERHRRTQRKTSAYTKEDGKRMQQEGAEIREGLAALMGHGHSDPGVQALVKRFHEYMNSNFYACSLEMLSGLGDMYAVSYTHLRAHETVLELVCRLLLEKKKKNE